MTAKIHFTRRGGEEDWITFEGNDAEDIRKQADKYFTSRDGIDEGSQWSEILEDGR